MNDATTNDANHHDYHPNYDNLAFRSPVPVPLPQNDDGDGDDDEGEENTVQRRRRRRRQHQQQQQYDIRMRTKMAMLLVSCQVLKLSMETTFTAACLLHRYTLLDTTTTTTTTTTVDTMETTNTTNNTNDNDKKDDNNDASKIADHDNWQWTIACIIFIACKAEEEHRRLRDLINLARMLSPSSSSSRSLPLEDDNDDDNDKDKSPAVSQTTYTTTATTTTATTGVEAKGDNDRGTSSLTWKDDPPKLDDAYWKDKEHIVRAEQIVLRRLAFDVHVSHPHRLVVLLVEDCLLDYWHINVNNNDNDNNDNNNNNNDKDVIPMNKRQDIFTKTVVEGTWELLNTCVFSVAALQQSTLALSVAALDLTLQQQTANKPPIPTDWWKEATGLSQQSKDAATQVLRTRVICEGANGTAAATTTTNVEKEQYMSCK